MGCVSYGILRLHARWRSPRQETILWRSDNMLSLNRAWSSSLCAGRISNDTPLPRTKSWRWTHRPRPPPPPHRSAAIATKKSPARTPAELIPAGTGMLQTMAAPKTRRGEIRCGSLWSLRELSEMDPLKLVGVKFSSNQIKS